MTHRPVPPPPPLPLPATVYPERLDLTAQHARAWPSRGLHDRACATALEAAQAARLPAHTLMQRAGLAVVRLARAVAPHTRQFLVLAGPGNNGGDGFEAARLLHRQGHAVQVLWLNSGRPPPADAAQSHRNAQQEGVPIDDIGAGACPGSDAMACDPATWLSALPADALIIDALLGRGVSRAGPADRWIAALSAASAPVLAIDLPSGLDGDTGRAAPACVRARWTLALLTLAPGLFTAEGRDHAGEIWFDPLGTTPTETSVTASAWLERGTSLTHHLPSRRHRQHKGSAGDVWIVGGATGMAGAALLAGQAAVQAGAGRVYLDLLAPAGERSAPPYPELLHGQALDAAVLERATVVAGCGGGLAIANRLAALLTHSARLVLDADALNAVASDAALSAQLAARSAAGRPTVITPHPLEAARLLGLDRDAVQADRLGTAGALARRWGVVALLKGSGSVVAAPDQAPVIIASGNAALATAGTGDVLAGCLGALWSRLATSADAPTSAGVLTTGEIARSATRAAAYLHGWTAQHHHPGGEAWPAGALAQALSSALEHWRCAFPDTP